MGQMRIFTEAYVPLLLVAVQTVFRTLRRKYRSPAHRYLVGPHAGASVATGVKLAINAQSCLSLKEEMKKEPNQAVQTTPGLRPSVSDL